MEDVATFFFAGDAPTGLLAPALTAFAALARCRLPASRQCTQHRLMHLARILGHVSLADT
jgi:hypothetical protein